VKNPLAAVRGAVEVIGMRLPADSRDAAVVKEIVTRIDSLNDLMKDLLLFARPPRPQPVPVDVLPLVASTIALMKQDPEFAAIDIEVEGSAPPVSADPGLLSIVFLNLLVNGAHAMGERGRMKVSVSSIAGGCDIVFRDHGPGIPEKIREKIFAPFFTTKSHGTGLGLATVKRLVEAHRGMVDVQCPSDGGTAVTVRLPANS
jgi:two-component system sensor histidine kinase PilS (NtrC family)